MKYIPPNPEHCQKVPEINSLPYNVLISSIKFSERSKIELSLVVVDKKCHTTDMPYLWRLKVWSILV